MIRRERPGRLLAMHGHRTLLWDSQRGKGQLSGPRAHLVLVSLLSLALRRLPFSLGAPYARFGQGDRAIEQYRRVLATRLTAWWRRRLSFRSVRRLAQAR